MIDIVKELSASVGIIATIAIIYLFLQIRDLNKRMEKVENYYERLCNLLSKCSNDINYIRGYIENSEKK